MYYTQALKSQLPLSHKCQGFIKYYNISRMVKGKTLFVSTNSVILLTASNFIKIIEINIILIMINPAFLSIRHFFGAANQESKLWEPM